MKFLALATALFALAVAAADKKNYIITFAKDTPQSVVNDAMDKVIAEVLLGPYTTPSDKETVADEWH